MTGGPTRTVAAFDFDGTLTTRDTFVPFLARLGGWPRVGWSMASGLGAVARRDRDAMKAHVLARLVTGRRADDVRALAEAYGKGIVAAGRFRDAVLARLDDHRGRGDGTVIVSASLEDYLRPVADHLGIDHVIGTRLEVGPDGRLSGVIEDGNCRGPEKVRRLDHWLAGAGDGAERPATVVAYGDSAGDHALLDRADEGWLVRAGGLTRWRAA